MVDEGFKRKLSAILSADVKGYSRLMDNDEEATVRTLTTYRTAISDLVQQFRGRVIDTPGDNVLSEFPSVVDAVNCAVEIQRELSERNAELAYNRKMEFRIGINLGDVIEEDGRIYGDGVNITARVESLADAGGICISSRAYEQVANKLGLDYEDLGEHDVKNISTPIRVYRVLSHPGAAAHRVVQAKETLKGQKNRILTICVVSGFLIIAIIAGVWKFYNESLSIEPASIEKMAFDLPEKQSIAVLPFVGLGEDPDQELISDALTQDIISALSHQHELFVIDRHSSSTYKGKPVTVQKVAEELGVRYVLEGSVQKSADQIRISVQLIDAINGEHIWTERYDKPFTDLFALEDDITLNIMKGLSVELFSLTHGESAQSAETDNLEAWLLKNKAQKCGGRQTKEGVLCSLELNEKALEHDPNFVAALVSTGWNHWHMGLKGYSDSPEESSKKAIEIAQRALEMAPDHAGANGLMVGIHMTNREFSQALTLAQKNINLDPNNSELYAVLGWVLLANMRPEETIQQFKKAIRLSPNFPRWYYNILIRAHVLAGKYDEALSIIQKQLDRKPGNFFTGQAYLNRAAVYSNLGQQEKAKAEMAKALEVFPKMTLSFIRREVDCADENFTAHYFETLEKLGLPE